MSISAMISSSRDFETLCSVLEEAVAKKEVLEIELLPSSLVSLETASSLCRDGGCIGIPKLLLVQAYLHARRMFFEVLGELYSSKVSESPVSQSKILSSSAVMLLYDPEHLTAANARKRILLQSQRSAKNKLPHMLASELCLLETLLTSHLNRHTKSPTLWYHRMWILSNFLQDLLHIRLTTMNELPISRESCADLVSDELRIVNIAGEKHPKNYYAWNYAKRLVKLFDHLLHNNSNRSRLDLVLITATEITEGWCLHHPEDTSAWSFLAFLLAYGDVTNDPPFVIVRRVVERALSLHWKNKCVWGFLKFVMSSKLVLTEKERADVAAILDEALQELRQASRGQAVELKPTSDIQCLLVNFLRWVEVSSNAREETLGGS